MPFVWSDQYDRKIQTVGHFRGDDEMEVVHGTLEERRFVAVFGRAGRLVGALGFSMPAKVMQYRKMIEERASFADALERARVRREADAHRRPRDAAAADPRFVVVVMISGVLLLLAMGAVLPVIPRYVDKRSGATTSPSVSRWARSRSAPSCCARSPGASVTASAGGCS